MSTLCLGYLAVEVAECERRLELSLAAVERDSLRCAGKNTSGEAIAAGRNNKGRQEVILSETRDSGRHEFSSANCHAATKSWSRGVRRGSDITIRPTWEDLTGGMCLPTPMPPQALFCY